MTAPVLLVVADGRPGGGTTNVLALAGDLRAAGVPVRLCTQMASFALAEAGRMGVPTEGFDFFSSRLSREPVRGLARLVASLRPQVVHANGNRAAFFAARARTAGWPPLIYTVRGIHSLRWPTPIGRFLGVRLERWLNRRMDATVYVGEEDLATARTHRLFGDAHRAVVIRNGVVLADLPPALPPLPGVVAFLGRLHRQKDPLILADIAAALGPGWRIRVIGGGPLEGALRDRAKTLGVLDRLDLRGELPRAQALAELREASALILPSLWEGLPIAPIEAMGMGVPAVVSRAPGNTEVVRDGETGLVVAERSGAAWAAALRRLADDPALRARLVAAAREDVANRFDRTRTAAAYQELYRSLAGGR